MSTLRESLATLRSDMRTQLSELRGELESEKNARMMLEKEVGDDVSWWHLLHVMIQQTFAKTFSWGMNILGRSLEEEAKRLILLIIIIIWPKIIFSNVFSGSINY